MTKIKKLMCLLLNLPTEAPPRKWLSFEVHHMDGDKVLYIVNDEDVPGLHAIFMDDTKNKRTFQYVHLFHSADMAWRNINVLARRPIIWASWSLDMED